MSREPRWIKRVVVEALHLDQLREHGGGFGFLNEAALDASLDRPRNRLNYEPDSDLPSLAASYAHGICTSHPFRDGNKRTAFVVGAVFLELNGLRFTASEESVIETFLALASGKLTETDLATWFRDNSEPAASPR